MKMMSLEVDRRRVPNLISMFQRVSFFTQLVPEASVQDLWRISITATSPNRPVVCVFITSSEDIIP